MLSGDEREERVMALAESILAQPPGAREEFLRSVCGGDLLLLEDVSDCVRRLSQTETAGESAGPQVAFEAFAPGTVLANRFRIVRSLGEGGMGMVYEAIDQTLDRRVAIKCAKPGHQMSLPPEARLAREVSHFNVCKVHDLHTAATPAGEMDFLSMEFVEGETLSARLKRLGPLKPDEATAIARQICAGLAQAHRQGVIHGDLKPGNIILSKTPAGGIRAVITDFGLAKVAAPDGSRVVSPRGGTRDYMAPELLLGERASIASDLYAFGILFHAMLAGRTPAWTVTATAGSRQKSSPPRSATPDGTTVTMTYNFVEKDWRRRLDELPRPWKPVDRQVPGARSRTSLLLRRRHRRAAPAASYRLEVDCCRRSPGAPRVLATGNGASPRAAPLCAWQFSPLRSTTIPAPTSPPSRPKSPSASPARAATSP